MGILIVNEIGCMDHCMDILLVRTGDLTTGMHYTEIQFVMWCIGLPLLDRCIFKVQNQKLPQKCTLWSISSLLESAEGDLCGRHVVGVDVGRAHLEGGGDAVSAVQVTGEDSACINVLSFKILFCQVVYSGLIINLIGQFPWKVRKAALSSHFLQGTKEQYCFDSIRGNYL